MAKEEADFTGKSIDERKFLAQGEVPKKKKRLRFSIPYKLRYTLIWIFFFSILGIVIQSIQAGQFIFADFFASNYAAWFRSFGGFTQQISYAGGRSLLLSIMGGWYYFFLTGGYISLIWDILSMVINHEIVLAARVKKE